MNLTQSRRIDSHFWSGKKIFLTGHTGFKGGWLVTWLSLLGAKITGYSLNPNTNPNLFEVIQVASMCEESHIGDIRDFEGLKEAIFAAAPDIVIHMAAQALVRPSYTNPLDTYATNVMGTLHVLEAIRFCKSVKAVLVVTSDKCYENKEWVWGYRENDPMGGYDPYSNSKGCAELIVSSYRQSFFSEKEFPSHGVAIASARSGNVIGGGDWSTDRLIPDAIKAFESGRPLIVRNPSATRPWQHVLEPLSGYLMLAQALYERNVAFNGGWNFGPNDTDSRTVSEVIELLISKWNGVASWACDDSIALHEANFLKLDCSKARQELGWSAQWSLEKALSTIVQWQKVFRSKGDIRSETFGQIDEYINSRSQY